MTGKDDDERDPNWLYIRRRLVCVAFLVFGAFVMKPWQWQSQSTYTLIFSLIFSLFWYGILIYTFLFPWKMRGGNGRGGGNGGGGG